MALTATIYTFSIELTHMDRDLYATLDLRVAQQPSETLEYMLTRVLAYCLEYREGIAFSPGISAGDQPAILARDLTGQITLWVEVGMPDAERLHRRVVADHFRRHAVLLHDQGEEREHQAEREAEDGDRGDGGDEVDQALPIHARQPARVFRRQGPAL